MWRCFLGAPRSASRTPATHSSLPSSAGLPLLRGIGAAGDMSSMSAYFATVFRLTWSIRAISDLERPAASIDRISFTVSRGTVISSILPGRARQSNRPGKPYGEGRAPGPRGAALLLKLVNFSCSRCLFPSDHSDHFLVNINTQAAPHQHLARRVVHGHGGGGIPGAEDRREDAGPRGASAARSRPRACSRASLLGRPLQSEVGHR